MRGTEFNSSCHLSFKLLKEKTTCIDHRRNTMIWYSDVARMSSSLIMKSPFFERNKLQAVANPLNYIISFYISNFFIFLRRIISFLYLETSLDLLSTKPLQSLLEPWIIIIHYLECILICGDITN